MTTAAVIPVDVDEDDPAPIYGPCESRETALAQLRIIAASCGARVDEYRAGYYTAFVPGRLALLVDDPSGCAWLCTVALNGRLATLEASAVWEVMR